MKVAGICLLNGRVTGAKALVKNKIIHAAQSSNRWSSSENNTHNAWNVNFGNGNFNYGYSKYNSYVVRAVSAFSPLERGDFSSPSGKVTSNQTMTEESAVEFLRSIGYTGDLTKKIHL